MDVLGFHLDYEANGGGLGLTIINPLIIAASKWPQPHLNRFTHESNE